MNSVPRHCIPSEISRVIGDGTETQSSEERGAFSQNATKTWVEGGDLASVCQVAPLSSLVPNLDTRMLFLLRLSFLSQNMPF